MVLRSTNLGLHEGRCLYIDASKNSYKSNPGLSGKLVMALDIDYKLSSWCFSVIDGTGPKYLPGLLTIYNPSRQLRSASDNRLFRIPSSKTKTNAQRFFLFFFISNRYSLERSPSHCQIFHIYLLIQVFSKNAPLQ